MNYNWPAISVNASSGPIQITIDGVPTTINIDTVNPENSVLLPVANYGFYGESAKHEFNVFPVNDTVFQDVITLAADAREIEIINTSGVPLEVDFGFGQTLFMSDKLVRQAIYLKAGVEIAVRCAQTGVTADVGIFAVNLFK